MAKRQALKLGVTGGIGSGKSTVCRVFSVLGIPVFNADDVGKRLLNEDPELISAVRSRFGAESYANGTLDRSALAAIVFNDPGSLADLNALVHPRVRAAFAAWADEQEAPYVVMEAALMSTSGSAALMDHVAVVHAPEHLRTARVIQRDGSSVEAVNARMKHQSSEAHYLADADTVITNDGTQLVIPQVLALHEKLLKIAGA